MKTCTQCGETKAYSEYYVRRASRDGLTHKCKACVKAQKAEYYKANADQIRARQAEYYNANADQIKAYKTDYYKANRDQIKAYKAANADQIKAYKADYRKANADRIKAQQAEYYKANADQIKEHHAANPHIKWESNYRIRARRYGFDPVVRSFTREDMIAYWNNGERCIYCNGPFEEIEHLIPVGLGGHHVISNVAPSCGPCNRANTNTVSNTRKTLTNA